MHTIAVVIPCHNEALTIGAVVEGFRKSLPEASIHVFDNSSSDGTADVARAAGAQVHLVPTRGKGEAVRAMFRDVEASVFVMVDGDLTYPAERARDLIQPIIEGRADMVVATRLRQSDTSGFRRFHLLGNRIVLMCINALFDARLSDVLSGYRAFSRRFVKTMPVLSRGFEIETEMTLHALEHRVPVIEMPIAYGARPPGSESKLHTFRDGYRVLATIVRLYKDYRPLQFFGIPGVALLLIGIAIGFIVVREFLELGHVVGVARAVFAVFSCLFGIVAIATALVLETVNRRAGEIYVLIADHLITRNAPPTAPADPDATRDRAPRDRAS
jgi:glycosyltransferase involved in cell wall biosynthesis